MAKPCKLCPNKKYGTASLCFPHWKAREKAKREEKLRKKNLRRLGSKKYQKSELKLWKAKTWKLMSEWVRRKDADFRGTVSCYTCGIQLHYKLCHASHFFHGKLDYDERNLKVCCVQCNLYLSGNLAHYAIRLTQEYGIEWVEKLRLDANTKPPYTLDELKTIYAQLQQKLESLK